MSEIITFNTALPPPLDGKAPAWVQLTPAGTFRGRDGRGPFVVDPAQVAAAIADLPAVIDEMHSTDLKGPLGGEAPARGWIVELQARADGVWGRVDWTPEGEALVVGRSYRGISPALRSDKATGRVSRVLRAALTNLPNFEMTTLHSQQDAPMDLDRLRAALGLKSEATLDDCIAAATRNAQAVSTHATDLGRLAKAAGAPANADIAGIETVLAAARPAASEATRLAQEVVSLNTQLGELRNNQARDRATTVIDRALAEGKPITALRDHYITRHMADPAGVELELGAMVSLHARGVPPRPPAPAASPIGEDEAGIAARMGVTVEQLQKTRDARLANGGRR